MSLENFYFVPFPSRIKASDTYSLGATTKYDCPGQIGRMTRRQLIVTNLSATLDIKIRTANSINLMTVFPRTALTVVSTDDLNVYNPNGSAINVEICEVMHDEGFLGGGPERRRQADGLGGNGGGFTGSGTMVGGGLGGGRQSQTP